MEEKRALREPNPDFQALITAVQPEDVLKRSQPFRALMMHYECAMREIQTKFEVLNAEFTVMHDYNPVESIKTRLKSPISIAGKLKRKGIEPTLDAIYENINDIAGVRVICSFVDDIYALADMLLRQDDITLINKKDYIQNPKESGYRSLHLIVEVPIFLTDSTRRMRVEVQLRTIAMDFWASLEHKSKYKKQVRNEKMIGQELRYCAEQIAVLDMRMQQLHQYIQSSEDLDEEDA